MIFCLIAFSVLVVFFLPYLIFMFVKLGPKTAELGRDAVKYRRQRDDLIAALYKHFGLWGKIPDDIVKILDEVEGKCMPPMRTRLR